SSSRVWGRITPAPPPRAHPPLHAGSCAGASHVMPGRGGAVMARTASVEAPELLLPARAHRPVLVLPEDPSDDELLRHWTLSEADTRQSLRCRADDNRRRFALHIC